MNDERGRSDLSDFAAVLLNKVALVTVPHTLFAEFMVGGAFVAGVAFWHLLRNPGKDTAAFHSAVRVGAATRMIAGLGTIITGDIQGKTMTEVQPMKMSAS